MSDRVDRAFNRSGAARAVELDIPKPFDRVYQAGLLHKLKSCEISGQIFRSYLSVLGGFGWFWMRNLHKNIQLMLEIFKDAFLILLFSYDTLMTFLILSAVLLSMLMILLSTLTVIRHLICDSN